MKFMQLMQYSDKHMREVVSIRQVKMSKILLYSPDFGVIFC